MSILLQPSTMLQSISFGHNTASKSVTSNGKLHTLPQHFCSRRPLAHVVKLVRHPVENVGETFDSWWDGCSKEERVRKQSVDQKKQILYLRLKEVRKATLSLDNSCANAHAVCRLQSMRIGKPQLPHWTTSRETMSGKQCQNLPITMRPSSRRG